MNESLLEIRAMLKERKPNFIRQDYQRRKRIGNKLKWRKPKGVHSKIRHHFKGWRKSPSPGYKSPLDVKGVHSSGLKMIHIFSVNGLINIKKDTEGIIISKNVGLKNRLQILKRAKELNISVLNLNADEHIKKIEEFISSKKKKTPEAKKEPKPKEETKQKEDAALTDKEKKESEKKDKDKLLTKKV
jgi:large subunit ribosomal protein L32e